MRQCPVCGETRFEGWDHCPACKHPFPLDEDVVDGFDDATVALSTGEPRSPNCAF